MIETSAVKLKRVRDAITHEIRILRPDLLVSFVASVQCNCAIFYRFWKQHLKGWSAIRSQRDTRFPKRRQQQHWVFWQYLWTSWEVVLGWSGRGGLGWSPHRRGILVIMVMSVILWHEKTKIRKIIGFGNFDVISVKTIIHNNIKKMGHLIWSLGVQLHAISWKWDVTRWHKAGWMIVVTCQTLFFCHKGTISAQ